MTIKHFDIDPANSDDDGIAEAQQPTTSVPFVLNGAMADLGTAGQFDVGNAYSSGIGGVQVSFTSAGNWSGVTITMVCKNQDGHAVTEAITGPNATTVTSTTYVSQILAGGITVSGTVATNIYSGPADTMLTKTIPVNIYANDGATLAVTGLSGTIQYDTQQTFSSLLDTVTLAQAANWIDVSSNKTTDFVASASVGASGVRLKLDSYTDGAELQFAVSQTPFR